MGVGGAGPVLLRGSIWKQVCKQQKSRRRGAMKTPFPKIDLIRVLVIESDPLRFLGLHALLDSESDFELTSISLSEVGRQPDIDLALLGNHVGSNLFEVIATLKAARPALRIIVMGSG